jgi:hypothetical protein
MQMRPDGNQLPQLSEAVNDIIRSVAQKQGFAEGRRVMPTTLTSSSLSGDNTI